MFQTYNTGSSMGTLKVGVHTPTYGAHTHAHVHSHTLANVDAPPGSVADHRAFEGRAQISSSPSSSAES